MYWPWMAPTFLGFLGFLKLSVPPSLVMIFINRTSQNDEAPDGKKMVGPNSEQKEVPEKRLSYDGLFYCHGWHVCRRLQDVEVAAIDVTSIETTYLFRE